MLDAKVYANMRLVITEAKNNLKKKQIPIAALIVNTLTNEIIAKALAIISLVSVLTINAAIGICFFLRLFFASVITKRMFA